MSDISLFDWFPMQTKFLFGTFFISFNKSEAFDFHNVPENSLRVKQMTFHHFAHWKISHPFISRFANQNIHNLRAQYLIEFQSVKGPAYVQKHEINQHVDMKKKLVRSPICRKYLQPPYIEESRVYIQMVTRAINTWSFVFVGAWGDLRRLYLLVLELSIFCKKNIFSIEFPPKYHHVYCITIIQSN